MNSNVSASQPPKAAAPPLVESPEERKRKLLAKVRIRREAMQTSGKVEGDPNKVYCWVNIRDERQTFFQAMGWTLVKDPNVRTNWRQADGTHKRADLILYEIPREEYEAISAERELRSIEALEGAEKSFETSAAHNGAPTFRPRV